MLRARYVGRRGPMDELVPGDVLPIRTLRRYPGCRLVVVGASCHPGTCSALAMADDLVLERGPHEDVTAEAWERHRDRALCRMLEGLADAGA